MSLLDQVKSNSTKLDSVASPDSGIDACYDLDSTELLSGDPVLGLSFDADLFEASTSTVMSSSEFDNNNYSLDVKNAEMLLPDNFMDLEEEDSMTAEKAITEAPVIICDVTPINVSDATALALQQPESGVKVDKSIHRYATRPPVRQRRRVVASGTIERPVANVPKVVVRMPQSGTMPHLPIRNKGKRSTKTPSFSGGLTSRKRKLYELGPFDNPEAERCRLNALNAKKNRERKKRQLAEAAEEIERLREENHELRSEADLVREELEQARQQLASLRAQLKADAACLDDREE